MRAFADDLKPLTEHHRKSLTPSLLKVVRKFFSTDDYPAFLSLENGAVRLKATRQLNVKDSIVRESIVMLRWGYERSLPKEHR
jgi:hypothetical protein